MKITPVKKIDNTESESGWKKSYKFSLFRSVIDAKQTIGQDTVSSSFSGPGIGIEIDAKKDKWTLGASFKVTEYNGNIEDCSNCNSFYNYKIDRSKLVEIGAVATKNYTDNDLKLGLKLEDRPVFGGFNNYENSQLLLGEVGISHKLTKIISLNLNGGLGDLKNFGTGTKLGVGAELKVNKVNLTGNIESEAYGDNGKKYESRKIIFGIGVDF
jgi:hypothetical protein